MGAKRIAVAVTTAVCTVAIMRERERGRFVTHYFSFAAFQIY